MTGAAGGGGDWSTGAVGAGGTGGAMGLGGGIGIGAAGLGGWIGDGAAGVSVGLTLNRPIRCWPHAWQLKGGVGRRTSAPQLTQT
jgi:hypothetical protein